MPGPDLRKLLAHRAAFTDSKQKAELLLVGVAVIQACDHRAADLRRRCLQRLRQRADARG